MNYLLLDLAKVAIKNRDIPYHRARVGLFAPFKTAKRMTTPEEPHSIYVLPKQRAAHSMITAIDEILSHHADARIAIVSPRPKVQAALSDWQMRYPQAQLICKKRLGKKIKQFLKNTADTTQQPAPCDEQQIVQQAAQAAEDAIAHVVPAEMPSFPTSGMNHDMATALLLLKKNRPKKKQDLLRLLAQHIHSNQAQAIVATLQQADKIHIDSAENVRYQ